MTDKYIEIRITNATADKGVAADWSEEFTEKFITGPKYTDIRFGPFKKLDAEEIKQLRLMLDFIEGLPTVSTMVTSKPY